jgi:hypothetical protein
VAALSFILDGQLWGANPVGYHLTNLLLHLASSSLVLLIAREVLVDSWLPAAAAGLIFALHPVHVEPVIWITGRVDMISTFGYLLGIYGLLRFRSNPAWHWLATAWIGYGAGIFAKEAALTLPLMALLCELLFVPRNARWNVVRAVAPYLGWGAVALLYYYCRTTALGSGMGAPEIAYGTISFWQGVALRQFFYLGQLFWPLQRAFDFAAGRNHILTGWLGMLGVVITIAIIWLVLERRRSFHEARVALFFGVVWYLVTTLPLMLTYPSPRHLYLASAGISVGLSAVFARLAGRRFVFAGVMAILILACGWQLRIAEGPWRGAGRLSKQVSESIRQVADKASAGDLLLLNVPANNNERAFIWSFASPFALRPPFQQRDLTRDFVVIEREPIYFYPDLWPQHPSFARLRAHAGAAWIISAMSPGPGGEPHDVQILSATPERVASVLAQPDLNLGTSGSFDRLIVGLTDKKQQ